MKMHTVFTDSRFSERKAAREKLPVIAILAVLLQHYFTGLILKCDMTFQLLLLKQGKQVIYYVKMLFLINGM